MQVRQLWLTDFRNYATAEVALSPGLTALVGDNGEGKSNLLEALGWLTTLSSFRGAPTEALVRIGAPFAVVRAEAEREGRTCCSRRRSSRRAATRCRSTASRCAGPATCWAPCGPRCSPPRTSTSSRAGRPNAGATSTTCWSRSTPATTRCGARSSGSSASATPCSSRPGGRLDEGAAFTLDVWDSKLAEAGTALAAARAALLERMRPLLAATYDALARRPALVTATYDAPWRAGSGGLAAALASTPARATCAAACARSGPHRDEVRLAIGDHPARTHASQGEQRTLALALRLAAHRVVTEETGTPPILMLDDVFSELDPDRRRPCWRTCRRARRC